MHIKVITKGNNTDPTIISVRLRSSPKISEITSIKSFPVSSETTSQTTGNFLCDSP